MLCTGLAAQKYNLLPDTIGLCDGDSASIEIRHQFERNASIKWQTPGGVISGTKRIKAVLPGKYFIRITSSEFSQPLLDSSYLKIYSKPFLQLRDTGMCRGRELVLDARNPGMKYTWNNGKTTPRITVNEAGRYWVKVTNGRCSVQDTIFIRAIQGAASVTSNEVSFCLNDENKMINVKTGPGTKIAWNTGATTAGIYVSREGNYWVRTEHAVCGAQVDTIAVRMKACDCEMIIPNSFTPNEDNRNDYFFPVLGCDYSYYLITITDRWGNTVYTSNNALSKWDGRYKGNLCPEDIYVYRIESTEKSTERKQVRNGHISLFR